MKITCTCGATIHDGPDGPPHKGHLICDRDWDPVWAALDAALERPGAPEAMATVLRGKVNGRRIWECGRCGRLWVDTPGGGLASYAPDSGQSNKLFDK